MTCVGKSSFNMSADQKPARFRCPNCNADMDFDPQSGALKCRYCAHIEATPTAVQSPSLLHPLKEFLAKGDEHLGQMADQSLQVTCEGCGSMVVFQPPQVAGLCSFCAAAIIAQPKAADPLIAPDGVLPFKVPTNEAQAQVRQWLQTRWFAPNALKRMARSEGIGGVYLPFWDYASDTDSRYSGQRGTHYWETEVYQESDGRGGTVQQTRQVQRTAWSPVSGRVSRHFDHVLIAATRSIAESKLNALEPWDMEAVCTYEPAYLAGFKAQRYQVELPAGFEEAQAVMRQQIEEDAREDIGGDEQRVQSVDTEYSNTTFCHLLLPVWIGAYRFRDKVYQVVVNARTGEVQGERPYSPWKISLLVAAILFVLLLIWLAKSQ